MLEYIFICVFLLLVSSKLDIYDPAGEGVLEELLGFEGGLVILIFS